MTAVTRRAVLETIGLGALAAGFGGRALAQAPAFATGMRYVFFSGSASIPGAAYQVVPDGNGGITLKNGQKLSLVGTSSASGAGFLAFDLQRADASGLLFGFTETLLYDPSGYQTKLIACEAAAAPAQGIVDFWLPPSALAQLQEGTSNGVQIRRGPYPAADRTFQTVSIVAATGGGWTQDTYDLESGLMIAYSGAAAGAPTATLSSDQSKIVQAAGTDMLAVSLLEAVGPTNLPGPGAHFPDWFRAYRGMRFSGQTQTVVTASYPQSYQVDVQYDFQQADADRVLTQRTMTALTARTAQATLFAAGTVGSLWMDPNYLGTLQSGQELHADQLLGLTIACAGPYEDMTVISARAALTENLLGYNRSTGLLSAVDMTESASPATIKTFIRLTGAG